MQSEITDPLLVSCPYCGEEVELSIDTDGGSRQQYVEDYPVCCQPWQVQVTRNGDGEWYAVLRREDDVA